MAILEISNISKSFGGVQVSKNVTMFLEERGITALIGPNGAGKTTLFNVITRVESADSGNILFHDQDVNRLRPYDFARLGILRTFQRSMLFGEMTLLENVLSGRILVSEMGILGGLFKTNNAKKTLETDKQKAMELLKLVGLSEEQDMLASKTLLTAIKGV